MNNIQRHLYSYDRIKRRLCKVNDSLLNKIIIMTGGKSMKYQSKIVKVPNFRATKLNNERELQIYLPPSYDNDISRRYPVLYIHDGQNVFDIAKGSGESWSIDTVADRLIAEDKIEEIIIVAIVNFGTERMSEYFHYAPPEGEFPYKIEYRGLLYEDFIINDVKKYVDSNFRTLTEAKHTALMGSSAGGFVSYNIAFRNSQVFGKVALMSPYFAHLDVKSLEETKFYIQYEKKSPLNKIWVDMGELEGLILPKHARDFVDMLLAKGYKYCEELAYLQVPEGRHSEAEWSKRVHAPLIYFFGNIGNPQKVELHVAQEIGIKGAKFDANPIVTYDSGFMLTDLEGNYNVENPNILEVDRSGRVLPKSKGSTLITYNSRELKDSKVCTVIDVVSEYVQIDVLVEVPENTLKNGIVNLYGLELKTIEGNVRRGIFKIPRGTGFVFRFTISGKAIERDKNMNPVVRSLRADKDLTVNYVVENWEWTSDCL